MYKIVRRIAGWFLIIVAFGIATETRATGIDEVVCALLLIAGTILAI